VVERTPGVGGFNVQARRLGVERSFRWLSRTRRLQKDYKRKTPALRNASSSGHDPPCAHAPGEGLDVCPDTLLGQYPLEHAEL
jgi:hypothetical protein